MRLDKLTLDGWRNYQRQTLAFDQRCNVIYGENAQGKTNLLEAAVYLSCGKSPRAHGDRELIGFERQDASLTGQIFSRLEEGEGSQERWSLFRPSVATMRLTGSIFWHVISFIRQPAPSGGTMWRVFMFTRIRGM